MLVSDVPNYNKMERILVYLAHPAQFHFMKNTIRNLQNCGIETMIVIKTKDILSNLLNEEGFNFVNIQTKVRRNTKINIFLASLKRTLAILKIARRFKPDLLIGSGAPVAQVGWLLKITVITALEDDECIIKNLARMTYPFTTHIIVPNVCSVGKWDYKKIGYDGYMKLAYLHPNYFTPNHSILDKYGIDSKYILIRLAKLEAHHDVGIKGLTVDLVEQIIQMAEKNGYKALISSEAGIVEKFKPYQLIIRHTDIHHIMAFASLLISDSQSMSVEAAMLGTPNIRFSDFSGRISVLEELENVYGLTNGIRTDNSKRLIEMVTAFLSNNNIDVYRKRQEKMLNDKIDVTAFYTWFIENYPHSKDILKSDPDYQLRFK